MKRMTDQNQQDLSTADENRIKVNIFGYPNFVVEMLVGYTVTIYTYVTA